MNRGEIKPEALQILQHTIGADEYGQIPKGYDRNHFITGPGCANYATCQELVSLGLMTEQAPKGEISGGMSIFRATAKGRNIVKAQSPIPPKLSKSKERYRRYRECRDCFPSFLAFLKYCSAKEKGEIE